MPHRVDEPMSPQEIRAHKHGEKARVRASLRSLRGEVSLDDVDDLPEPGRAWKTPQKAWDPDHESKNPHKHWRRSFWKRRSALRATRAARFRAAGY